VKGFFHSTYHLPHATRYLNFPFLPSSCILSYFSVMIFQFNIFNLAKTALLLILFLSLPVTKIFAQGSTIWFESLTNNDGLSSNAVNAVVHDQHGFVWIGTQNGLNVWDGTQVISFYKDTFSDKGLKSSDITAMAEDSKGQLWVGTNGNGIYRFNRNQGYFNPVNPSGLQTGEIHFLFPDSKGNLWIGTHSQGLWKLAASDTIPVLIPGSQFLHSMSWITELSDGQIIVGTLIGLYHISQADNRADPFSLFPKKEIISLARHINTLFIGTPDGLYSMDEPSGLQTREPKLLLKNMEIRSLLSDSSTGLWIGTESNGLWHLNFKSGELSTVSENPTDKIPSPVSSLLIDQDRNLWIGLSGMGVRKLDLNQGSFNTVSLRTEGYRGLTDAHIWSISMTAAGDLMLGTRTQGVLIWNPENKRFHPLPSTLFSPTVAFRALYTDPDGVIWTGTDGKGITAIYPDGKTKSFRSAPDSDTKLNSDLIRGIYPGNGADLLICTRGGGFSILNRFTGEIKTFSNKPDGYPWLGYNNTWMAIPDSGERVWVANSMGIALINPKKNESRLILTPADRPDLGEINILSILDSKDGFLWLATRHDGLIRFSKSNHSTQFFQTKHGLPSNGIYGLIQDKNKRIWMSTDHGIAVLNPESGEILTWSVKNGIPGNEFNSGSFFQAPDGHIFFGGADGVVSFHPDHIYSSNSGVQPLIRKVSILDPQNRTTVYHFWQEPKETLSMPENLVMLGIDFSGMEFQRPDRLRFSYLLDGYNEDWVSIGSHHNIQFTGLEPGFYTLRIRETSTPGFEKNETKLEFSIPPAFWQTLWFKITVVLLIASFIYLAFWLEIRRKLHIERLRLNIASDLHDDVGVLLTKISMKTDLLSDETADESKRKSLDTISNLTRSVIMTMSDSIWSIDSRNDRIANLTDRMKGFCRIVFENGAINYDFFTDGLNPDKKLPVDIRQNIFLIFKEAIHNCAKHSDGTEIKISLIQTAKDFTMVISDNGSGKESGAKGSGSGLTNMKLRADRINATLQVSRENGFTIKITRKPLY